MPRSLDRENKPGVSNPLTIQSGVRAASVSTTRRRVRGQGYGDQKVDTEVLSDSVGALAWVGAEYTRSAYP